MAKRIIIDLQGVALLISRRDGVKVSKTEIAKRFGITDETRRNYDEEAPNTVQQLYRFIKDHDIAFEDLVKEV